VFRIDREIEPLQRSRAGVARNAGVLDHNVVAFGAQHALKLRRIGFIARHQPSRCRAVAERDDVNGGGEGG
jgi:hypothetical protein